jgi:hypothetical protein
MMQIAQAGFLSTGLRQWNAESADGADGHRRWIVAAEVRGLPPPETCEGANAPRGGGEGAAPSGTSAARRGPIIVHPGDLRRLNGPDRRREDEEKAEAGSAAPAGPSP